MDSENIELPRRTAMQCVLLASRIILESGGETYRAEETIARMGRALGASSVESFALPGGVFVTLVYDDGKAYSRNLRLRRTGFQLDRVDAVNAVSRKVAGGELDAGQTLDALLEIASRRSLYKPLLVNLCAGGSGAFFALAFGASWLESGIAFFCALFAQLVNWLLCMRSPRFALQPFFSSFVCVLTALFCSGLLSLQSPDLVVAGAIMPLLPGISLTNAVRDTTRGDTLSGVTHAVNAVLVAALLAAGTVTAHAFYGLF
ncbi:MAG: threonine/serine exporter family protein [Eubacteriales bacterium]|nr:threonine/serine exporter family protein [Eubacteriales bacterium]MDD4512389.1 threonine/serine exporter family protein [Eubacteriales bacterium]